MSTTPRKSVRGPTPRAARVTPVKPKPTVPIVAGAVVLVGLLTSTWLFLRPSSRSGRGHGAGGPGTEAARTAAQVHLTGTRPRMPEVDSRIFEVTEATGRVETFRAGKWVLVMTGDVLTQDDLVRTMAGRAILRRGATEIELRDRVEIRLDRISQAGASLDLRRGRVVANVGRSGGNVAITAARTRTANEGDAPARFIVTTDDRGRVAVAATAGTALFEAAGRVVSVKAGTTTHAEPGQPPRDPEVISEDIFLSVIWPAGDRREETVAVTGRADPEALVHVNGAAAEVDGDGHFVASILVREGANPVEVEVEDAAGRTKRERGDIRKIPTRPPRLAPVPTELWKK